MKVWAIATGTIMAAGPIQADDPADIEAGRTLVEANCAASHAVGRVDESAHTDAPPSRILSRHYPIEWLGEALAEGIMVGHPDMPEFALPQDNVAAINAYLESIQEQLVRNSWPGVPGSRTKAARTSMPGPCAMTRRNSVPYPSGRSR